MRMYTALMYSHGFAAAVNGINAITSAMLASKAATLRAALQPESWLTSVGRSIGMVKGPTVAEVGAQLGSQMKWAMAESVFSVGMLAVSTVQAVQKKRKKDQCTQCLFLL